MALDKVVDSAVLDAGMLSVADAIRAKTGDADLLAWPDGFAAAINALANGGENHGIVARDIITATENMTIYELLNAVEVNVTYENSLLLLGCYDDVTPDKGSYTLGNFSVWHLGTNLFRGVDYYFNGTVSFSKFVNGGLVERFNDFTIDEYGRLRRRYEGSNSCCVAAGGTFKIIEVPLNIYTFAQDMTLWGET